MALATAFVFISAALVYISRASLRAPGSHGFYRFFAWECILALALLNLEVWFRDPFAWTQILSWILLFGCLIPLYFGIRTLIANGRATTQRSGEPQLLAFEKTTALVTTGIYAYIRHPLYSSLLLLAWGVFLKGPGAWTLILAGAATGFLLLTARADEAECARYFGEPYRAYMQKTTRFLPYLF